MKKIFFILIISTLITSCGFQIVNQNNFGNYYVSKIETVGEKRINYFIKNNLQNTFKTDNKKPITLKINSKKTKSIKEKNIKNEITKFQLTIRTTVTLITENLEPKNINISKTNEYNVSEQYSQTLRNEKKIIEVLSDEISEEIIIKLSEVFNDL